MTTQKYADYIDKQAKGAANVMLEPCFGEYLIHQHGQRIGALYQDRCYLTVTDKGRALVPQAKTSFPYKSVAAAKEMLLIEDTDNAELLAALIDATFAELYGAEQLVVDFSSIFTSYARYPEEQSRHYDYFVALLEFCFRNKLFKVAPLDAQKRMLKLTYLKRDLTLEGVACMKHVTTKFFQHIDRTRQAPPEKMLVKWLEEARTQADAT